MNRIAARGVSASAVLLALACAGGPGKSGPDDEEELHCGYNAEPEDGECVCESHYSWCEDSEEDCCAYDARAFDLTISQVRLAPYKDTDDLQPWDWDGDIPDWLFDALDVIALAYPKVESWAEVLELVDEYAPELLEGTVPPDPYYELDFQDEALFVSDYVGDDYEGRWRDTVRIDPTRAEDAYLYFYDADAVFDDDVEGFYIAREDLEVVAGRGEITTTERGRIYSMTLSVEAVW